MCTLLVPKRVIGTVVRMWHRNARQAGGSGIEVLPGKRGTEQACCVEVDIAVEHDQMPLDLVTDVYRLSAGMSPAPLPSDARGAELPPGVQIRGTPWIVSGVCVCVSERLKYLIYIDGTRGRRGTQMDSNRGKVGCRPTTQSTMGAIEPRHGLRVDLVRARGIFG